MVLSWKSCRDCHAEKASSRSKIARILSVEKFRTKKLLGRKAKLISVVDMGGLRFSVGGDGVQNRLRIWLSGGAPRRAALFVFVALLAASFAAPPAISANSKYAAIIINAYTGKVLFSRNADAKRYPASLAKIMTLYLLFDALEKGDVTMNTALPVSKRAAGQAPSKLGLKAGETITVEQAIKALVVKSANDVATVVGEKLGGTEFKFSQMMTRKARDLGLTHTRFANASGLPNSKQYTTAREMVVLCRRLIEDFPQYYPYFLTATFTWKGRTHKAHNAVLKKFPGADGIKTGYIRASGFNLATSVRRDGYHLIGVVFGGKSTKSRDAHMKDILTKQFRRIAADPTLGARFVVIPQPAPKPGRPTQFIAKAPVNNSDALMSTVTGDLPGNTEVAQGDTSYIAQANVASLDLSIINHNGKVDSIGQLIANDKNDKRNETNMLAIAVANTDGGAAKSSGDMQYRILAAEGSNAAEVEKRLRDPDAYYGIQIGAYGVEEIAQQRLATAVERAPEILINVVLAIVPIDVEQRTVYRARIGPYDEQEAQSTCRTLLKKGITCFTVVQEDWLGNVK